MTFAAFGGSYYADAVTFDGSTYFGKASDFTGNTDSKKGTFYCNIELLAAPTNKYLFENNGINSGFSVLFNSTSIIFRGANSSGSTIFTAEYSSLATDTWYTIAASWDLTDTNKRHIIVNGSAVSPTYSAYTNDTIDYTKTSITMFNQLSCNSSDLWFNPDTYLNESQLINAFFLGDGRPADLGSGGEGVTGAKPLLFLSGDETNYQTNKGTGGGMTISAGSLSNASTSPSG